MKFLCPIYDKNGVEILGGGGDANTVNGYTVNANVPANAKFTDTVYTHPSTHPASMITGLPTSLPASGGDADTAKHLLGDDTRSVNSAPSVYMTGGSRYAGRTGWQTEFKSISSMGLTGFFAGTYCYVETKTPWSNSSGGYPIQIAYGNGIPCWRVGTGASTWGAWSRMSDGGDASTVTGFTVGKSVPSNAVFTDTVYTHPTTAGNKHIPSGGSANQVLKYSSDGTAVWGTDANTVTTINGKTGAIAKADITALGIPAQDTIYTHPSSHPASIITQDTNNRFVTDAEKTTWNGKADLASPTFTGTPKTTANTSYTTGQLRNIRLIAEGQTVPSLSNGEIALIYSTAVMP